MAFATMVGLLGLGGTGVAAASDEPTVTTSQESGDEYVSTISLAAAAVDVPTPGTPGNGGLGLPNTNCYIPGRVCPTGGKDYWHVIWRQQVRWKNDRSQMRHDFAETHRDVGKGSWKGHAHAALIEGHSYDADPVFSGFTHSCANYTTERTDNSGVKTCASPWQGTSRGGKWLLVSGHSFDQYPYGSANASCDGCIDWKWTVP